MARLSEQLIDRIKKDVSLVHLVEAKGFSLKPHGRKELGVMRIV